MIDCSPDGIWRQAQNELKEEKGFRVGGLMKLLDIYSHPGLIVHKVHLLVAFDLEGFIGDGWKRRDTSAYVYFGLSFGSNKGRLAV